MTSRLARCGAARTRALAHPRRRRSCAKDDSLVITDTHSNLVPHRVPTPAYASIASPTTRCRTCQPWQARSHTALPPFAGPSRLGQQSTL